MVDRFLLPMLHGHLDEAFLFGQQYMVASRMSIQRLWGTANRYYNSIPTAAFGERIGSALFVWRNQACGVTASKRLDGLKHIWGNHNRTILWIQRFLFHTCWHDVVSEERGPKPKRQHEQVAGEAWKELPEASGVGTEVGEAPGHQHTVWVEPHHIVIPGVQVSSLHQLDR